MTTLKKVSSKYVNKKKMGDKKVFKEVELYQLNFDRVHVPATKLDGEYTYYTLKLDKSLCLISDGFDKNNKEVSVYLFESTRKLSLGFIKSCIEEFKKQV